MNPVVGLDVSKVRVFLTEIKPFIETVFCL